MTITSEQKIETHPFLYFLPENPRLLIVGSFPGWEQVENKETEWFYTAKRNKFWSILSAVYNTQNYLQLNLKRSFVIKRGLRLQIFFFKLKEK